MLARSAEMGRFADRLLTTPFTSLEVSLGFPASRHPMRDTTKLRHIVLSGCSGGGKLTLLAELERRGFAVVPEPGRLIVEEEQRCDGRALPWVDLAAFAKRDVDLDVEDRRRMVD